MKTIFLKILLVGALCLVGGAVPILTGIFAASQITNTEKPCQCRDKKNITNTPGAAKKKPANAATKNITNKPGAAEKKLANTATKHTTNTPGAAEKPDNPAAKNITHKRGLQLKNLPIPRQQHYECAWCSWKTYQTRAKQYIKRFCV